MSLRSVGNALHFLQIVWPFCLGGLLETRGMFQDLRPCLLAILQEETRIKLNAATDWKLCRLAMLVSNL
jgi:hypothetical protein